MPQVYNEEPYRMLPTSVAVVSALETMPAGTVFHARYVYDKVVARIGRMPEFGCVMDAIEVHCKRLGQGYFQWGETKGRVNMRLHSSHV